MKRILFLFTLMLGIGLLSHAADKTISLTGRTGTASTITDSPFTITFAQNQGTTAPAFADGGVRLYYHSGGNGASLTISCPEGTKMTQIDFVWDGNYPLLSNGCSSGNLSGTKWTSTGVNSVTFKNTNTSNNQVRIASMTVTYEGDGGIIDQKPSGATGGSVTLDAKAFNGTSSNTYDKYTYEDTQFGFKYASVYMPSGNDIQFNTNNTKGKASSIVVSGINDKYLIDHIDVTMGSTPGNGIKVYSYYEAASEPTLSTTYSVPKDAKQVGDVIKATTEDIKIDNNSFIILPAGTGTIQISSVTVHYRAAAEPELGEISYTVTGNKEIENEAIELTIGDSFTFAAENAEQISVTVDNENANGTFANGNYSWTPSKLYEDAAVTVIATKGTDTKTLEFNLTVKDVDIQLPVVKIGNEVLENEGSKEVTKGTVLDITCENAKTILILFGDKDVEELTAAPFQYTINENGEILISGVTEMETEGESFSYTFNVVKGEYDAPFAKQEYNWFVDETPTIELGAAHPTLSFSENKVVEIDNETGKVKILGPGTATVTATWGEDEDFQAGSAEFTVTVKKREYTFSGETKLSMFVGDTATLYEGEDHPEFEVKVTDGENVITVEGATITAKSTGSATISITWGNDIYEPGSAEVTVTVTEKPRIGSVAFVANEFNYTGSGTVVKFSDGNISDTKNPPVYSAEGVCSLYITNNNAANISKVQDNQVRWYSGDNIVITPMEGVTIIKLVLYGSTTGSNNITNVKPINNQKWSQGTSTMTWEGRLDEEFSLTNSAQTRFNYLEITYETTGEIKEYCKAPSFDPASGATLYGEEKVTLSCDAEYDTTIKYTINEGNEETYVDGISFSGKADGEYTITAWAEADGYEKSSPITATYTYYAVNPFENVVAALVTSQDEILEGARYVIVGYNKTGNKYQAMTYPEGTNSYFSVVDADVTNNLLTLKPEMAIVTLEKDGEFWTVKTDKGYIQSAFSGGNNANLSGSKTEKTKVEITFNEDGTFTFAYNDKNGTDSSFFQYNSSQPRFSCYKGTQGNPYLFRICTPVTLTWKYGEEEVSGTHTTTFTANGHTYTLNVDPVEATELVTTTVAGKHTEVVDLEEGTHYTLKQDNNVVTLNHAGTYSIAATVAPNATYALAAADVTAEVGQAKAIVAIESQPWSNFENGNTFTDFISSSDDISGVQFNLKIEPAFTPEYTQEDKRDEWDNNCGLYDWEWKQMNAIETQGNRVDAYYSEPEYDETIGIESNVNVKFGASGKYTFKVTSENKSVDIEYGDNGNTIDIYPSTELEYVYTWNGNSFTDENPDVLNINYFGLNADSNEIKYGTTQDGTPVGDVENAAVMIPGVYFAELYYYYQVLDNVLNPSEPQPGEPELSNRRRANEVTVPDGYVKANGNSINLSALQNNNVKLSLLLVKNGAATPLVSSDSKETEATYTVTRTTDMVPTGVESVDVEADEEAEYFTLQGIKVQNPEKGIYIKVQNGKTSKVVL